MEWKNVQEKYIKCSNVLYILEMNNNDFKVWRESTQYEKLPFVIYRRIGYWNNVVTALTRQ